MKKYFIGMFLLGMMSLVLITKAQQPKAKEKKVVYKGNAYLSDGQTGNGKIKKADFDAMLDKGLIAKDSADRPHPVGSFVFMYAERGLFEDSTGKLRIMSDNYSLQCDDGRLPADWVKNIRERSKAGDTAVFKSIRSAYDDSGKFQFYTQPLKLIITD